MTTPYCDKNGWADREKGLTWANYVLAGYGKPDADELDTALEMATRFMNRRLGNISTNITDTNGDLADLCYQIANRIMDVKRNRGKQGAMYTFSLQDYMYNEERRYLYELAIVSEDRVVGGVG